MFLNVVNFIFVLTCINGLDLNNLDISEKQKIVLNLFHHVTEAPGEDLKNITANFNIEDYVEYYNKMENVKTFITMKRKGMLTKGDVFCLFCSKHVEQAMIVFKVLNGAKDFSTFLLTSVWMRQNISEMLFLYSFTVALRHRNDCIGIVVPPIYELYPFTFVKAKTQNKILVNILTNFDANKKELTFNDEDIPEATNEYSKLKYFTEDIGLNSFYNNFHIDYPFWMTDEVYGLTIDRRGELYIYMHKQLLSRYNMERLAFGFDRVCPLDPSDERVIQLQAPIMFHNGWKIPFRGIGRNANKRELIKDLDYLEMQIRDAIFKGLFSTSDGLIIEIQKKEAIEAWGRRIFGNVRSASENTNQDISFVTRQLLSDSVFNINGDQMPTTFLQFYETAIHDPIFFELTEYLMSLIKKLFERTSLYHRDDLYYYGIDITKVNVGPLITFMDENAVDITNFINSTKSQEKQIFLKINRLNYVPFNISISFLSNRQADCVVRIFLLPTIDLSGKEIHLDEKVKYGVELDTFNHLITQGNNTIIRRSVDFNNIAESRNITKDIQTELNAGIFNMTNYYNTFVAFPANLVLPRGTRYGLRFQIFVIVTPLYPKYYREGKVELFRRKRLCRYSLCVDERALGFPFDKDWEGGGVVLFPNMKLIDVVIFHKTHSDDIK